MVLAVSHYEIELLSEYYNVNRNKLAYAPFFYDPKFVNQYINDTPPPKKKAAHFSLLTPLSLCISSFPFSHWLELNKVHKSFQIIDLEKISSF